jgi:hypothetical protein
MKKFCGLASRISVENAVNTIGGDYDAFPPWQPMLRRLQNRHGRACPGHHDHKAQRP